MWWIGREGWPKNPSTKLVIRWGLARATFNNPISFLPLPSSLLPFTDAWRLGQGGTSRQGSNFFPDSIKLFENNLRNNQICSSFLISSRRNDTNIKILSFFSNHRHFDPIRFNSILGWRITYRKRKKEKIKICSSSPPFLILESTIILFQYDPLLKITNQNQGNQFDTRKNTTALSPPISLPSLRVVSRALFPPWREGKVWNCWKASNGVKKTEGRGTTWRGRIQDGCATMVGCKRL